MSQSDNYKFVNSTREEDACVLQLTLAGFGLFQAPGQEDQVLRRGDLFMLSLPSATAYMTRQGCDWRFAYIYCTGDLVRFHLEMLRLQRGYVVHLSDTHPLSDSMAKVLRAVFDAVHDPWLLSSLLYQCLMHAYPHAESGPQLHQMQKVQQYIEQCIADKHLSVAAMAAHVGKSQYHFSRQFKEIYGVSPYQYVIRLRVQQALNFLNTSKLSNGAIAERCGFNDTPHFNNVFKRHVGYSPGAYRKNIRY
jgi:AraC-like DNA-binding protein